MIFLFVSIAPFGLPIKHLKKLGENMNMAGRMGDQIITVLYPLACIASYGETYRQHKTDSNWLTL